MALAARRSATPPPRSRPQSTFGAGGGEPYASALQAGTETLELRVVGQPERARPVVVGRFARSADDVDLRVLSRARGPVLDVGCGPGRMVAASMRLGLPTLGVDVSAAAVRLARTARLPVLRRSVFDPIGSGRVFATVLLLDGNIGIGGSPVALLERCGELLAAGGNVLAEVDAEPAADRAFTGVLSAGSGRSSDPFPWAEVGHAALETHGRQVGLTVSAAWSDAGRSFAQLERES